MWMCGCELYRIKSLLGDVAGMDTYFPQDVSTVEDTGQTPRTQDPGPRAGVQ
jgi:hypothetical protein